jgi:hypothetical protein
VGLFLDTVSEFLHSISYDGLLVEIVDPRATEGRSSFPIRHDDQILRDWEGIRPLLLQAISQGLEWTSLQAYRRGYDKSGDDSIQTVVVCCEDYFSSNCKDAVIKINCITCTQLALLSCISYLRHPQLVFREPSS